MPRQTARFLLLLFLVTGSVSAQSVANACATGFGNDNVGCAADHPCITGIWTEGTTLHVGWTATQDFHHYDFRWSRPGKPEEQSEVAGGRTGTFRITNAIRVRITP